MTQAPDTSTITPDTPESDTDVILYCGQITRDGYALLTKTIEQAKAKAPKSNVLLLIATPGGDPDAGFRIGRALHSHYDNIRMLIPDKCKSAGTLITIAAHELVIGDCGELGPLDIQLRKSDEIGEMASGLDIFKAVSALSQQTIEAYRNYVTDIKFGSGISTRMAAEIASNLATGLIGPLSSQIDTLKLGEHQRAMGIAIAYGDRLGEQSKNLQDRALEYLVNGYPSHGFVIDRKEAKKLYHKVREPRGYEIGHYENFRKFLDNSPRALYNSAPFILNLMQEQEVSEPAHTNNMAGHEDADVASIVKRQPAGMEASVRGDTDD